MLNDTILFDAHSRFALFQSLKIVQISVKCPLFLLWRSAFTLFSSLDWCQKRSTFLIQFTATIKCGKKMWYNFLAKHHIVECCDFPFSPNNFPNSFFPPALLDLHNICIIITIIINTFAERILHISTRLMAMLTNQFTVVYKRWN